METSNLVVIAQSNSSGSMDAMSQLVVTSQSYLYETLCYLKDVKKLLAPTTTPLRNLRLSKLPSLVTHHVDTLFTASSDEMTLIKQIALMRLDSQYWTKEAAFTRASTFIHSFETQTIQAVLMDEQSICLRDLPAFYACA